MKKIAYLFVMSILMLISTAVYADDGYFTCGSDITEFSGKTFENLVVDLHECRTDTVFDGLTVTVTMKITGGGSVHFSSSRINRLSVRDCEIRLDAEFFRQIGARDAALIQFCFKPFVGDHVHPSLLSLLIIPWIKQ